MALPGIPLPPLNLSLNSRAEATGGVFGAGPGPVFGAMSIQYGGIGGAGEGSIWQLVALAAAAALAVRWLSKKL